MTACRCQFCAEKLEPAQELRFLVETETLGEPAHLNRIRRLPFTADGRPLRVCVSCQTAMESQPVRFRAAVDRARFHTQVRAGVVAAAAIVTAGWFLASFLAPRA